MAEIAPATAVRADHRSASLTTTSPFRREAASSNGGMIPPKTETAITPVNPSRLVYESDVPNSIHAATAKATTIGTSDNHVRPRVPNTTGAIRSQTAAAEATT